MPMECLTIHKKNEKKQEVENKLLVYETELLKKY